MTEYLQIKFTLFRNNLSNTKNIINVILTPLCLQENHIIYAKFEMRQKTWLKLTFNGQNNIHVHIRISPKTVCSSVNIRSMKEDHRAY